MFHNLKKDDFSFIGLQVDIDINVFFTILRTRRRKKTKNEGEERMKGKENNSLTFCSFSLLLRESFFLHTKKQSVVTSIKNRQMLLPLFHFQQALVRIFFQIIFK
jgi:hypothetical protein